MISTTQSPSMDKETLACIEVFGAVIRTAIQDARKRDKEAILFFRSPTSPFWEMCNQMGARPEIIIKKYSKS